MYTSRITAGPMGFMVSQKTRNHTALFQTNQPETLHFGMAHKPPQYKQTIEVQEPRLTVNVISLNGPDEFEVSSPEGMLGAFRAKVIPMPRGSLRPTPGYAKNLFPIFEVRNIRVSSDRNFKDVLTALIHASQEYTHPITAEARSIAIFPSSYNELGGSNGVLKPDFVEALRELDFTAQDPYYLLSKESLPKRSEKLDSFA